MKIRRRPWRWVTGFVLIGALTAFCVRVWPHERLLLQRVTRITASAHFEQWISDHEIARSKIDFRNRNLPGAVFYTDLTTGKTLKFPVRKCPATTHAQLDVSPDGRWALSWEGTGPEPGAKVTATELRTGRTLSWPSLGDTYHDSNYRMPDGKHWFQGTTLPEGYLMLYSLGAPQKAVRLRFPGFEAAKYKVAKPIAQNHLVIPADEWWRQGSHLGYREYRLFPEVTLMRTVRAESPGKREIVSVTFSPGGDRIAWVCTETYEPPLNVWLRR